MRLTGTAYRAHNPRWAFLPASGEGAALHGGRFNEKGVPALYTSLRLTTAWLEAQQGFPFKAQPMTIVAYDVDCADILDLTDPAERERLKIDAALLASPWEYIATSGGMPPTWSLARQLRAAGAVGILVPSFAPGATHSDVNAVFWDWSQDHGHKVQVIDDFQRLPVDDASWPTL